MYMATSDKHGPGQRGGSKSELGIFETEEKAKTWIKQQGVRGQTYWQLVTIRGNTSKLKLISRGVMNAGAREESFGDAGTVEARNRSVYKALG